MPVRGQYAAGTIDGKSVAAYSDESRVARDSRTETYAALNVRIDNPRWNGVPFTCVPESGWHAT